MTCDDSEVESGGREKKNEWVRSVSESERAMIFNWLQFLALAVSSVGNFSSFLSRLTQQQRDSGASTKRLWWHTRERPSCRAWVAVKKHIKCVARRYHHRIYASLLSGYFFRGNFSSTHNTPRMSRAEAICRCRLWYESCVVRARGGESRWKKWREKKIHIKFPSRTRCDKFFNYIV